MSHTDRVRAILDNPEINDGSNKLVVLDPLEMGISLWAGECENPNRITVLLAPTLSAAVGIVEHAAAVLRDGMILIAPEDPMLFKGEDADDWTGRYTYLLEQLDVQYY